jgi:hypothetical protein
MLLVCNLFEEIKVIEPVIVMLAFLIFITIIAGPQAYRNWREARKQKN